MGESWRWGIVKGVFGFGGDEIFGVWGVRGGVGGTLVGDLEWLQMAGTEEGEIF